MLASLTAVALLATWSDPETLPPPPTDAAMLAALIEERPGARLVGHQVLPMAGERKKVCGTAEIAGQVEPFAVITEEGDRSSVVVTPPGQQPPARPPGLRPRHWDIDVFGAGAWAFIENSGSDPRIQNLDAVQRQLVLRFCPMLQPPAGVAWRTEIQQD